MTDDLIQILIIIYSHQLTSLHVNISHLKLQMSNTIHYEIYRINETVNQLITNETTVIGSSLTSHLTHNPGVIPPSSCASVIGLQTSVDSSPESKQDEQQEKDERNHQHGGQKQRERPCGRTGGHFVGLLLFFV